MFEASDCSSWRGMIRRDRLPFRSRWNRTSDMYKIRICFATNNQRSRFRTCIKESERISILNARLHVSTRTKLRIHAHLVHLILICWFVTHRAALKTGFLVSVSVTTCVPGIIVWTKHSLLFLRTWFSNVAQTTVAACCTATYERFRCVDV